MDSYQTTAMSGEVMVDTYSNGIKVLRVIAGNGQVDDEYLLLRTDYSDVLLDEDGNGIDDRAPLNSCGYTDLNFNFIIDGVPSRPDYVSELRLRGYELCEHGVLNSFYYCSNPKCVERLEQSKRGHSY